MVKHNLQISLRLFSKTLNTFSFSKHILMHMSSTLVNTSGNNQIQIENTCHLIEHNHSKLIQPVSNDVTINVSQFREQTELRLLKVERRKWGTKKWKRGARDNIACDVDEVLWPDPGQRQEAH